MRGLQGKTVAVTGGGGGIGGATCKRFGAAGAKVAVLDRNLEAAQVTAKAVQAAGGIALALACDITKRDEVDAAAAERHPQRHQMALCAPQAPRLMEIELRVRARSTAGASSR